MATVDFSNLTRWEALLDVGDRVRVTWGYGLGFRARGAGRITRCNRKSFRVALEADVPSPYTPTETGWTAGTELRIPRRISRGWHPDDSVWPPEDAPPEVGS